jgi:hypothetical protein
MTRGRIALLLLIFSLLVAALVIKGMMREEAGPLEEAQLKTFFPKGSSTDDIERIEIFLGREPSKKVVLERQEQRWTIPTLYNVPADEEKVSKFLETIEGLHGELRSQSSEVLGDYSLDEASALHFVLFEEKDGEPLVHLLMGKGRWKEGFVREEGSDAVYRVPANLREMAGIFGSKPAPPRSSVWMRKLILELKKEEIQTLSIRWPDKSLVLKRREVSSEAEGESQHQGGPEAQKEVSWEVQAGGPGRDLRLSSLEGILSALGGLRVKDAVDPEKRKEWGLADPPYRLEVSLPGGKRHLITGGRPDLKGDGYIMVDQDPVVYRVNSWTFQRLFPPGGRLFELSGPGIREPEIMEIKWSAEPFDLHFAKKGDRWTPQGPIKGLRTRDERIKEMAGAISRLKPADYTDIKEPRELGLLDPWTTISVTLKGGESRIIKVGSEARSHKGRYALVRDGGTPVVISSSDLKRIAPRAKDVLDLRVFPAGISEVRSVKVSSEMGDFVLTLKGKKWRLEMKGEVKGADSQKVRRWLSRLGSVSALDLLERGDAPEGRRLQMTLLWGSGRQRVYEVWEGGVFRNPDLQVDLKLSDESVKEFFLNPMELLPEPKGEGSAGTRQPPAGK